GGVLPWTLLPGTLDEPLLLTRDERGLNLLPNVCTHRGATLVERPCTLHVLRCGHHGRVFELDGHLSTAPGFDGLDDFPLPGDNLPRLPWTQWGPALFASLDPVVREDTWLARLLLHLGSLPLDRLEPVAALGRDYHLPYSWVLCCDNLLETFHVPYVHPQLDPALGHDGGELLLLPSGSLRTIEAADDAPSLPLATRRSSNARRISSRHAWLFPCTFISAYPWGLRAMLLLPLSPTQTRMVVMGWTWSEDPLDPALAAGFDQLAHEDQRQLATVARALTARYRPRPRYSPEHERGVHHFHRLLTDLLHDDP
ncbi:MAG: SRPBCC family protein, partial [Nannocystaceae bacterium]